MTAVLREKALIRAAEKYAEACHRFTVYVRGAPDGDAGAWRRKFRDEYDRKLAEIKQAELNLLRIAQRI